MSKGLGRIESRCLLTIRTLAQEITADLPGYGTSTFRALPIPDLLIEMYGSNFTRSQEESVKRAIKGLVRKGAIWYFEAQCNRPKRDGSYQTVEWDCGWAALHIPTNAKRKPEVIRINV